MGYPLYEFLSARMTNMHRHGQRAGALWSYNRGNVFGTLDFDFQPDDPTVTFRCIQRDGTEVKAFPLRLSELSF